LESVSGWSSKTALLYSAAVPAVVLRRIGEDTSLSAQVDVNLRKIAGYHPIAPVLRSQQARDTSGRITY